MKLKFTLILLACVIIQNNLLSQKAQDTTGMKNCYVYKTEDDFFNNKKTRIGKFHGHIIGDEILYYIDTITLKKNIIEPAKLSYFAVEYPEFEGYVKKIHTSSHDYTLFGGGVKNIYCVMGGTSATYNPDGYIKELFWRDWFEIYYTDKINNIQTTKIEDILKNKPALLDKYLNEKKESDKKAWKRNKIPTEMRYLKLYIKEYSL